MSEMSVFEAYCSNLNRLCESMQDTKETVSHMEAELALVHAKSIELDDAADVLLFCASINLMNAYVKQPGCRSFGYFFKGYVRQLIDRMNRNPIEGVRCDTQVDDKSVITYVEVCGIQFSFHCVKGAKPTKKSKPIRFDGIRKQRCASTLFKMAETSSLMLGKGF